MLVHVDLMLILIKQMLDYQAVMVECQKSAPTFILLHTGRIYTLYCIIYIFLIFFL